METLTGWLRGHWVPYTSTAIGGMPYFCFRDEESNKEVSDWAEPAGSAGAKIQVGLTAKIRALLYCLPLTARVKMSIITHNRYVKTLSDTFKNLGEWAA